MLRINLRKAATVFAFTALSITGSSSQVSKNLEATFLSPEKGHRPLIIWQWMDGLVTKEAITRDLEAFKSAGLAGMQNFQIGGPGQMRIGNAENAIGNENWKGLLKWTLDECERLDLTFGTHNCPGWSSSAYPTVKPEYSMLKLVYSETHVNTKDKSVRLPRPEVDSKQDYYEDIAVFTVSSDSVCAPGEAIDMTTYFNEETGILSLPKKFDLKGMTHILRIGQTTNGKTNEAQAPESGRGLECDKLSREAVLQFWKGYPSMVLEVAGRHAGKTFTHFEIDSYEAGGQTWSPALPEEFKNRMGYDLIPYLPYMAGRIKTLGDEQTTKRFRKDWEETVKQCVAENYYGYMSQLCREAGVRLMIEPYGTGSRKPFEILDFYKIAAAAPDADIATEFWQAPGWGWRDMGRHEIAMRRLQRPLLIAEAFTCWPLRAWEDSPETLKTVCDKAFCSGVNRMMLHAGAVNPWPNAEPGMSFGKWGTQFVPGQTWWKAGGAKALFDYMARCQSLLQQGLPAKEQLPRMTTFLTYHRVDHTNNSDIIFVCNPTDSIVSDTIRFATNDRGSEIWDPYSLDMVAANNDSEFPLVIEPGGSRFIIITPGKSDKPLPTEWHTIKSLPVSGKWTVNFPDIATLTTDRLFPWQKSEINDVKYFSGTAQYKTDFILTGKQIPDKGQRILLSLGDVKNMAKIRFNGKELPILWKTPFECDITGFVIPGKNTLEIDVTNLWPNRMIGDEQLPDDLEWSEPEIYTYSNPPKEAGRYLASNPDWLINGTPRPSSGRKTVVCYKFFKKDSPLLPSGLYGPVELLFQNKSKR